MSVGFVAIIVVCTGGGKQFIEVGNNNEGNNNVNS